VYRRRQDLSLIVVSATRRGPSVFGRANLNVTLPAGVSQERPPCRDAFTLHRPNDPDRMHYLLRQEKPKERNPYFSSGFSQNDGHPYVGETQEKIPRLRCELQASRHGEIAD
jgi:hypothetical protein